MHIHTNFMFVTYTRLSISQSVSPHTHVHAIGVLAHSPMPEHLSTNPLHTCLWYMGERHFCRYVLDRGAKVAIVQGSQHCRQPPQMCCLRCVVLCHVARLLPCHAW